LAEAAASFSDGVTAARRGASIAPTGHGLDIAPFGQPPLSWRYDEIEIVDRGPPLVLARRGAPARLSVSEPGIAIEIRARLRIEPSWRRRSIIRAAAIPAAILVCALLAYVAIMQGRAAVGLVARAIPPSWEAPVGDAVADQIARILSHGEPKYCVGEPGMQALDTIIGRLNAAGAPPIAPIRVVDTELVNALAAPGGRLVLFRGLIDGAKSPDELAGVLAHEMAHVAHRHQLQALITGLGISFVVQLVTTDVTGGGTVAGAAQYVATAGFTRGAEREADALAKDWLVAANISTVPLADFFDRLSEKEKTGAVPRFLSTHPASPERAELFRAANRGGPPVLTPDEWQALKAMCKR